MRTYVLIEFFLSFYRIYYNLSDMKKTIGRKFLEISPVCKLKKVENHCIKPRRRLKISLNVWNIKTALGNYRPQFQTDANK